MESVLVFENIDGFRLRAKKENKIIEITPHYTAPEGDFYVTIEDTEKGTASSFIFRNFREVINFIEQNFGKTNLEEFERLANYYHVVMFKEKYILKWKGLKGKKDIYNRLSHIAKEEIDRILFS
jgi:hypothetical protein